MSLLSSSANTIKYVLFGFNLAFLITGIILIAVGGAVGSVYYDYEDFLASKFFSIPSLLIVTGIFIIFISFFGCWGAFKENYCMVLSFSVLLSIIFILELAGGISGYVLRNDAYDSIDITLRATLSNYNTTKPNSQTVLWDFVQRDFQCCGVANYTDWNARFNSSLPISCCEPPNGIVGTFHCTNATEDINRFDIGCLRTFSDYIAAHAVSLGAAGVIIAIIQFFGVIFACYIAREIKIRNGITGFI